MEPQDKSNIIERVKTWYRGLPDKKRYVEFVTAILTVPVLATVLYANVQNLQRNPETNGSPLTASGAPVIQIVSPGADTASQAGTSASTPTATPNPECKKSVGPVQIDSPKEGQVVSSDPVAVDISRSSDEYCAIVWSYRINGSAWSDYTDKSIFLYGLSSGQKILDLRIKSVASGDQVVLSRTFIIPPAASPTPQSTGSGSFE